jgi:hypothetical protein
MNPSGTCPINLGPKQKRRRLVLGIVSFLLAAGAAVFFVYHDAPPLFRLLVFPLFFLSMLGFFQAKNRTCVVYAVQGVRDLGTGTEKVTNGAEAHGLRLLAQKILVQAFFFALLMTAITLLIR